MAFTVLDGKLPLTEKCLHYDTANEVPWDIQKYWHQRYSIFQYYDYDIRMTDDAWFGVTPEPVATKIAADLAKFSTTQSLTKSTPKKTTIIDLFAGAGGNTIAFALTNHWTHVIGIEKDASTLACAQHNAEVYGVSHLITWVHWDCFEFLAEFHSGGLFDEYAELLDVDPKTTTLFMSPPWGGVSYRDHEVFDLSQMQPYSAQQLHEACRPLEHTLFLPRSSDLNQVAKMMSSSATDDEKLDVVQYCMEGASKAMVVYVPEDSTSTATAAQDDGDEDESQRDEN
ncbi:RNA cap guanine-N2 methyltransferase-domain-containing protein [Podospora didyma]|uniref:Trimethylguanosine synthase n=1 Tax=Podospora didyma TaxID=330526 RepID=A0AAE0P7I1_9PEZI|nr:RNA cap guanine-N2 methyltransferase-domain-containing protein [Podospora didyma]